MKMSNKVYDVLKFIAQIALPAIATLVFTIFKIWNVPYGPEIVGTISAVDVCLGAFLGISSSAYRKEVEG